MYRNTTSFKERVYVDNKGRYEEIIISINRKCEENCMCGVMSSDRGGVIHVAGSTNLTDYEICDIEAKLRVITPSSTNTLVQSQKVALNPLAGDGSEDYRLSLLGEVPDVTAEDIGNTLVLAVEDHSNIDYNRIADFGT